jgi:CSLREA domain-containing protein
MEHRDLVTSAGDGGIFNSPNGDKMSINHKTLNQKAGLIVTIFLLMASLMVPARSAQAQTGATLTVNSNSDADNGSDGVCTLREAMHAAYTDANYHECVAVGTYGFDTIEFSISGSPVITLTSNLPAVDTGTSVEINGYNSGSFIVIDGAGLYEPFYVGNHSTLHLLNMTIQHGFHPNVGGAVWNSGWLTVDHVTFLNNSAANSGGAVHGTGDGSTTISNSTFSGNSANVGGAVTNSDGTLILLNSTLSGNSATSRGGALYIWYDGGYATDTTVSNSILANSIGATDCGNFSPSLPMGANNIVETSTGYSGYSSCSPITTASADPKLDTLTGVPAYFPLKLGSPALDAGNDSICTTAPVNSASQNGVTRPGGAHCDIGSFELPIPQEIAPNQGSAVHTNRPVFDWTDYPGASGYQLQVSRTTAFSSLLLSKSISGAANSYLVTTANLPVNTLLWWRVRAKVGMLYTPWSAPWYFSTGNPPSIPSPSAPMNNSLTTNPNPLLDWSNSSLPSGTVFDHYQLQVDDTSDFSSTVADINVAGLTNSSSNVGPLNSNTTYYWRVRAWNNNGDFSGWSAVRTFREAMLPPVLLSPIAGASSGGLHPFFDWNDVAGATGYSIQVSLSPTFNTLAINVTLFTATSQYTAAATLQTGQLYYWRVRSNGPNGPSVWSAAETFTTP